MAALDPGVRGRFDWSQELVIDLPFGELASAPAVAVLNGANLIAARSAGGIWEVLSFQRAEEIESRRWRLTGLLRGLAGTDDAMRAGIPVGSPVVVLDEAVKPLGLGGGEAGLRLNWIAEAAGSTEMAGPYAFEGGMRARTPLAPVHLRGLRSSAGDIRLSWVRCGMNDADSWIGTDIPLDEPFERYHVEILAGGDVLRAVETQEPSWTYPLADEIADFGAPQATLTVRIRQMGTSIPLGIAATATFSP